MGDRRGDDLVPRGDVTVGNVAKSLNLVQGRSSIVGSLP
jgi:hypothetical protein